MDRPVPGDSPALPPRPRRRAVWWWILFLVALTLRAGVAYWRPAPMDGDQTLYLSLAESMSRGEGYLTYGTPETAVHPLLPAIHASTLFFIDDARLAGYLLTILVASLVPLVAGRAIERMLGFEFGFAAGIALTFQPHHVLRSSFLEPDLLAALLCFWLVGLLWRESHELSGVVLGLAYLNRPEMCFLLPVVVLFAWVRGAGWKRIARLAVLFLAVASVFLIYVRAETGRWALSGKDRWVYLHGVSQWRSGNQPFDLERAAALEEDIKTPVAHAFSNPGEFVLGYLYRSTLLLRHLGRQLLVILIPFTVLGAIHAWRRSRTAFLVLILPVYLLPLLPVVGVFYRHSLVAGTVLVALAGIGIARAVYWVRGVNLPA